jgi:hypothetical protein
MNMKTWISMLLILASVSLFGCDDRRSKEQLNSTMNSWIGRDINEFVRKYGTPTTTLTLSNGNTIYSYKTDREEAFKQPIYVNESRNRRGERSTVITGGNTIVDRDFCEINVEFDRSREIQSWRYEGDSPKHCNIKSLPKTLQKQLQKDGILP